MLTMPVKCHHQLVMVSETIKLTVQVSVKVAMSGGGGGSTSLPSDMDYKWTKQDSSGASVEIEVSASVKIQISSSGSVSLTISGATEADAGMYTATVAYLETSLTIQQILLFIQVSSASLKSTVSASAQVSVIASASQKISLETLTQSKLEISHSVVKKMSQFLIPQFYSKFQPRIKYIFLFSVQRHNGAMPKSDSLLQPIGK
jgi:hypothetical protein